MKIGVCFRAQEISAQRFAVYRGYIRNRVLSGRAIGYGPPEGKKIIFKAALML